MATIGGSTLVKGRWKILRRIGAGAFGEIYSGRNVVTSELVAIKIERVDSRRQVLKLEVAVLKRLQSCPWVVSFLTCGRYNDYNYLVMELLGENLSELRRRQPNGRFSMLTSLKLAMQMISGIEAVHDLGYLHRDIKPSNFAMGYLPTKRNNLYLIDFGLARKYVTATGELRPERPQIGFRGTARYASINSHLCKDLSRRDDLWSFFYVLIELVVGFLPWRRIKDKDQVGEMKIECDNHSLVQDLPEEFTLMMDYLHSLTFDQRPDYAYILKLLQNMYTKFGGDDDTPYDWERVPSRAASRPRPLPSLVDLCFFYIAPRLNHEFSEVVIPNQFRKRTFDFQVRVNSGRISSKLLEKLIDPSFSELDLTNCELIESDYRLISEKCSSLKKLSLGSTSDTVFKQFVTYNTNFESLTLYCSKLTSKSIKLLGASCIQLQKLTLNFSERITDKSIEVVLRGCSSLEELNLSGCKKVKGTFFKFYTGTGTLIPRQTKKKPFSLRKLDLSFCELSKSGFKQLVRVVSDLQALVFSPLQPGFKITSTDFISLVQNCINLQVFDLCNYHFEMDTILIEVSRSCTQLNSLVLEGIGMTDFGLQHVVQNCTHLETLKFKYGDGVTQHSLEQISRSCSSLKSLGLDFWNKFKRRSVPDVAIKNLLCTCTNLIEFSLCNCHDITGACFPEHEYFQSLTNLNLSECIQLNDLAIRRIIEICPELRKLYLNNLNNLTEVSLQCLPIGCPQLEELYLLYCSCFYDDSIKNLLRTMPKLFISLTRYSDSDLNGVSKEVHVTTVDEIFGTFPNTFRERAFDKTRKKLFGVE